MVAASPLHTAENLEDVELRRDSLVVHEMVETDPEVLRVVREAVGHGRRRRPTRPASASGSARVPCSPRT